MRILLALLVACCIAKPTVAQTIVIGHMPVINQNESVAAAKGFYKQNGLDVQTKIFQTGPAALQGLLSGDLQAVEAGGSPMLNLAAQNLPVYFLVSGGINTPEYPAGTILIRKNETAISSFKDLKGRRFGTLPKGTITNLWLSNAVQVNGMVRSDLQEVSVPFPQMGGLLASGQVDAVYAWPPFDTMFDLAGQTKVLTTDVAWNPYAVVNGLIVRRDWADKNPELVKRLISASIQTNRWINDHQDEAREVMGKALNLAEPVYRNMRMFYFPRNGYQPMPSIWDYYYLMIKSGELKPFNDPAAVIRQYWHEPAERFIKPALEAIGKEKDTIAENLIKIKLQNLPGPMTDYLGPWEK